MEKIINRPKMTLAITFIAALMLDLILNIVFDFQWVVLAVMTFGWICLVLLLMLIIRIVVLVKEKHIDWKKYSLTRPVKKVSVVVPNYNYADYLKERIDSIILQTYPIYELIILDDASSDNSIEVINEIMDDLKTKHPCLKVRFIPNKKNSGNVFKQWEKCFEESEGDFIWICEADDSCSRYFLNAAMRAFDDKKVVLSYTESYTVDEEGKKLMPNLRPWIDEYRVGHWDHSYTDDGVKELSQYLCVNNTIPNVSGVVFRRIDVPISKYLKKAQEFRLVGDWYFYAKYLLHGKIAYCAESLNYHRMHNKGVTMTTDGYKRYLEIKTVQDSIAKDVKLSAQSKKKIQEYRKVLEDGSGLSQEELKYMQIPFEKILKKSEVQDKVLLSVIVNAYNVEQFIEKCLNSVIESLPIKSEIVVVDDGSTDNTATIVKRYQKEYPGILRYYFKKNGGLSTTKNFGLTKVKGRYVVFMDADDEIKPNGYHVMLKKALEKDADIVVCDMALVYEDGAIVNCPVYHERPGGLKGFLIDGLMASSNNKLIKRKLYNKVGKYPEGLNNEDVAITPVLMTMAKNIQYIPSSFYKYYQHEGSIQNSSFKENRLMIFDTVKMADSAIRKISPEEADDILGIMIGNQLIALLVHVICNIKNKGKRGYFIEKFVEKYRILVQEDNKYIKKYCSDLGLDRLPEYLAESSPRQIYSYIEGSRRIAKMKDYVKRAFGIRL